MHAIKSFHVLVSICIIKLYGMVREITINHKIILSQRKKEKERDYHQLEEY